MVFVLFLSLPHHLLSVFTVRGVRRGSTRPSKGLASSSHFLHRRKRSLNQRFITITGKKSAIHFLNHLSIIKLAYNIYNDSFIPF